MKKQTKIEIPAPKFEQYESVLLDWNGRSQKVKSTRRYLDFDFGNGEPSWLYQLNGFEDLYSETVLEYVRE